MTKPQQGDQFAKPTFRAVNQPHLLFGCLDWRYGVLACLPALFVGAACRSRIAGLVACAVFQAIAYGIYSRDPQAPLIWAKTVLDKKALCPFKE